jgi:hypothetical protein
VEVCGGYIFCDGAGILFIFHGEYLNHKMSPRQKLNAFKNDKINQNMPLREKEAQIFAERGKKEHTREILHDSRLQRTSLTIKEK